LKAEINLQQLHYIQTGIDALEIDDLNKHLFQRDILYRTHLGIPKGYFKGSKVLEFGPNGGENSIYYAEMTNETVLCDSDSKQLARIASLYDRHNLKSPKLIHGTIQNNIALVADSDIVIAEGFLHVLEDRHEVIKGIMAGGPELIIVTIIPRNGFFWEALRRLVGQTLSRSSEFNSLVEDLFKREFKRLKSNRSFRSYFNDNILNSCISICSTDQLSSLSYFQDYGYRIKAVSPTFSLRVTPNWYKSPRVEHVSARGILESLEEDICRFNRLSYPSINNSQYVDFLQETIACNLENIMCNIELTTSFLSEQLRIIVIKLIESLHARDLDLIHNAYTNFTNLNLWGTPSLYIAFEREQC
jgi:hypothetical protein